MKKLFLLPLLLVLLQSAHTQKNYAVENAQERLATRLVNDAERGDFDSVFHYLDSAYLKQQMPKIGLLLHQFYTEFKTLPHGFRRFRTLVLPTGFNCFSFRYVDNTGTVLQIDLSFKKDDIHSKIQLVATIDKATFKKQAANAQSAGTIEHIGEAPKLKYPVNKLILLRNCQNELRTVTFGSSLSFFKRWVFGWVELETNKLAKFSKSYVVDSIFLRENIETVKRSLPPNFVAAGLTETWYENEPGEKAIWFIQIFAQEDKAGKIKIFSAYKITFEGNDARVDRQRTDPAVTNVEFIIDKKAIETLEKKLKGSPQTSSN